MSGPKPQMTQDNWQWWWSEGCEAERCQGPFSSREEAIAEAFSAETDPDYTHITIVEATQMELRDNHLGADWVIERFNDCNEDAADPEGDQCIERTTPEQERELEERLKAAWVSWRTKHGLGKSFAFDRTRNEETLPMPSTVRAETDGQ